METGEIKKSFSKLGLVMVLGAIIIEVLQIATIFIVTKLAPVAMKNENIALIVQMAPMYLVGMPALIYALSKLPGTKPVKQKVKPWYLLTAVPMSYCIMQLANIFGAILVAIFTALKGTGVDNVMLEIVSGVNPFLRLFIMVICAPIYEELVFRKMIVEKTLAYGEGAAILTSGLMFGLFHGNFTQFAYAFALGCFFAFIYVKLGDLRVTVFLHMCMNFVGGVVGGFLLDLVEYNELLKVQASGDVQAMSAFLESHMAGVIALFAFGLFVILNIVVGIVLLIVFRKKMKPDHSKDMIPKGQRFSVMYLNLGMILYGIYWIVMIIVQLVK